MHPVGFKPETLPSERPHTHALDDAATGDKPVIYLNEIKLTFVMKMH